MKPLLIGSIAVMLGAGVIALIPGGEVAQVAEVRKAVIVGNCTNVCADGVQAGDRCVCLTDSAEPLPGEITKDSASDKLRRLIVCKNPSPKKGSYSHCLPQVGLLPPFCVVAAENLPGCDVSMSGISDDLVEQLAARCAPCQITPSHWGPCPWCLLDGNCAEVCK